MPAMGPQGTAQNCLRGPALRAPHFLAGRCAAEDAILCSVCAQHKESLLECMSQASSGLLLRERGNLQSTNTAVRIQPHCTCQERAPM